MYCLKHVIHEYNYIYNLHKPQKLVSTNFKEFTVIYTFAVYYVELDMSINKLMESDLV